jgi:hypothetical protein
MKVMRARKHLFHMAAATGAAILVAALATAVPPAGADTSPAAGTPATVSADALPTVQVNGVVWSQVTVGNTVVATGSFSETWPAGVAETAANETPRANLLAYDITTGALLPTFSTYPLNGQGLVVTASPDGSRVYVGGDFTKVGTSTREHIAAFDASGVLVPTFAPDVTSEVRAISANSTTVYAGGTFTKVGSSTRNYLAAFSAVSGSLLTNWVPSANRQVDALLITPDQKEVVIGGAFQTLNGTNVYGLGAVTTATAYLEYYVADAYVRDYTPANAPAGKGAAILSLSTDGTQVYGSGYSFGEGNFEGTFGLVPDTGHINFLNDCHGDTYSVQPVGSVLYSVGHAHDCSAIRQFPDTTSPRIPHHALAETTAATGQFNVSPDDYGWTYGTQNYSTLLDWYPDLSIGTFTGQDQAAWSVTGNSTYIALGGEFPKVNGKAQTGLVRFAISSAKGNPNKVGPMANATALTPTVTAASSTSATLNWSSTWDEDNQLLTYRVYRDGAGPIYTTTTNSNFWQLPAMSFTDT